MLLDAAFDDKRKVFIFDSLVVILWRVYGFFGTSICVWCTHFLVDARK